MSTAGSPEAPPTSTRRVRRLVLAGAAVAAAAVVTVILSLFQPWKLWVDDKVNQAAPVGATPLTAVAAGTDPVATSAAPASTAPPTAAPAASTAPTTAPPTTAPPTAAPATTTAATAASTPPAPPVGTEFVGLDHGASGTLLLLQDEAGTQFVRFENLDTSNGPGLYVYLTTNRVDGPEGAFDDDYINLGRLQGNVGSQNYEVPAGTDLSRFASVVIWCDRFDSAFGAAPLA